MTRAKYLGLLIGGAVSLGLLSLIVPEGYAEKVMEMGGTLLIILFIPILAIIRMRYLGMSGKEFLLSFIPIYGAKYRYKRLFSNKKKGE
ncbi:hypothetical protein HNQ92_003502 [Rhabdobacter roseus]|uniref:Uncharacterized protein n=1 Tax=Rhabdobacter roseus TaxID=1655419 RepID=A0A840TQZ8_9BACT|nr:hypothetical protein [Rhabdobacter roseus]MBB5285345.1 hypothetical protein [Rhabdobacter roseus]